ncbi:MAG TPA: hypothetical protein VKR31_00835 [Rhizomicrobium sp.]|nr:hypothetical protein [Rhizomicrobium sp.]
MQLNFGAGNAIGKRTDIANAKPSFLGVLQDLEIDIAQTLKELTGAYKMPVDVAPSNLKVTGKAKFARIQGASINNLLLGQTETDGAGIDMAIAESFSVPGSPSYVYQVTNHATFIEDLGVFYANGGAQLQPLSVLVGNTPGQYTINSATGTYTFASGDAGAALVCYYSYLVSTLVQISLANQLMGTGPVFELQAKQSYAVQGTTKELVLKLNACRASKWSLPFKNTDYTIQDFEFTAFCDSQNNWGTWSFSE